MQQPTTIQQDAIDELRRVGLNLFAASPITQLPKTLQNSIQSSLQQAKNDVEFQSFILIGNAGPKFWGHLEKPVKEANHPFDVATQTAVASFIQKTNSHQNYFDLYPSDRTDIPLQAFARNFNWSEASPLGIDIHLKFGLWFGFRKAFVTSEKWPLISEKQFDSICKNCQTRECKKACPAQAVGCASSDFNLKSCGTYRLQNSSNCFSTCLARMACPYQNQYRYSDDQMSYHMTRKSHLTRLKAWIEKD